MRKLHFVLTIICYILLFISFYFTTLITSRSLKSKLIRQSILSQTATGTHWLSILCSISPGQTTPTEYIYQAKGVESVYTLNLCKTKSPFVSPYCDQEVCSIGPDTNWLTQKLADFEFASFQLIDASSLLPQLSSRDSSSPMAVRITMKSMFLHGKQVIVYIDAYCSENGASQLIAPIPPFFANFHTEEQSSQNQCYVLNNQYIFHEDDNREYKCPSWMNLLVESPNFYYFQINLDELC